mgnify:CR=1 FL=1
MEALPEDTALLLCSKIRRKLFSTARWQCWGCITFSKGKRARMCGGVVSCNLVLDYCRKSHVRKRAMR